MRSPGPNPSSSGRSTLGDFPINQSDSNPGARHEHGLPRASSESSNDEFEMSRLDHSSAVEGQEEDGAAYTSIGKARSAKPRNTSSPPADQEEMDMSVTDLANKAFMRKTAVNVVLIGLWYLFSVSISVYNKWMFGGGQLDFHFPIFTTSVHMIVQFGLSTLVLYLVPSFRPRRDPNDFHDGSKGLISPGFYLTRIAPCATATGLDIGLGNTSLRYVTLIFFTMCKSSTLGFVLLFAIIFRLEKPSWKLAGIISVMTAGVIMMVAGETAFSGIGFTLLMLASSFSGLRWSLTQMLLRRNPATSNPFASLFFLTPIMFVVLLVLAIPVEGFGPLFKGIDKLADQKGTFFAWVLLIFPGCLAFCMTSAEFALLKRTSVVTLSVCGIFKEVVTIAAGGLIFDETLTPINISGLFVTILAIAGYNYVRMTKMKQKAMEEALDASEEQAPMLPGRSGPDDMAPPELSPGPSRRGDSLITHSRRSVSLDEPSRTPALDASHQE